MLYSFMVF